MENANKRIRRFMPGNTDLVAVSQRDLTQLARNLNASRESASVAERQPKCSSRICKTQGDPLPCNAGMIHLG